MTGFRATRQRCYPTYTRTGRERGKKQRRGIGTEMEAKESPFRETSAGSARDSRRGGGRGEHLDPSTFCAPAVPFYPLSVRRTQKDARTPSQRHHCRCSGSLNEESAHTCPGRTEREGGALRERVAFIGYGTEKTPFIPSRLRPLLLRSHICSTGGSFLLPRAWPLNR